jgi:hypothetical protein
MKEDIMSDQDLRSPWPIHRVWWGLLILLVIVLGTVMLAPKHTVDPARVMLASIVGAVGTLVMAGAMAPLQRYPRWAYWSIAAFYAALMLVSPALVRTPANWVEWVRPQIWFLPWFFLTMTTPSHAKTRACSPSFRWSGAILVGTGVVFAGLVFLSALIPGKLR